MNKNLLLLTIFVIAHFTNRLQRLLILPKNAPSIAECTIMKTQTKFNGLVENYWQEKVFLLSPKTFVMLIWASKPFLGKAEYRFFTLDALITSLLTDLSDC